MKIYYFVIFVSSLFYFNVTKAQPQNISFSVYTPKQGLSSGTVFDILKDSFGFIWLATEDGLNRFDGNKFKVYRHDPASNKSLRVNHIACLYESPDGNIWIGTNGGGLSFYDRKKDSIVNFEAKGASDIGVAITSITGDSDNNIWVTSFGGAFIIDGKTGGLIRDGGYGSLLQAAKGKTVLSLMQDSRRRIWLGLNGGAYRYDPATRQLKTFVHLENDSNSIIGNVVNKMKEDNAGNIWIATEDGVSMLNADGTSFRNYTKNTTPRLASINVFTLNVDKRNRVWIGTEEGLDLLDVATNKITNFIPDSRNSHSISNRSIRSIFIDNQQGTYWVGTYGGGLNKYDENFNYFKLKEFNAFDPAGLRWPVVTAFAEYNNGVFVGTDGGGVQFYNRKTDLLDYINLPHVADTKHDLTIMSLELSKNKQLWIGTFRSGIYRYNPATGEAVQYLKGPGANSINNNEIFSIKEDRNGNIWLGTNGGGINVLNPNSGEIYKYVSDASNINKRTAPASNFIRSFAEDKNGVMWVGTYGGGISVFHPDTKKFTYFNKANSNLPSDYVITIKEDSKGNMWVGTGGNGLGLLTPGSKIFKALNEQDGLSNATIQQIVEDANGKIWVSNNNGLSCYDPSTGKFKNYSGHNGLQTGAFMPRAGLRMQDGELYFGGRNGFNHFEPTDLKSNARIPNVVLTELKVDNIVVMPSENAPIKESILVTNKIHLKYKQAFSIAFEALDFTVPEANQLQYMLEGFDKNWVPVGKEHSAYYANIPPGNYTFRVRASNNDGVWNEKGRSISIIVQPPFWRTIYAYAAYVILFFGTLYFIRKRGILKIQQRYALEQERQTARQLIEREREEAGYLRKLDQMKIKFLTNLSHEFRTPISLITGPVDNLIAKAKDENSLSQLNLIKRNGRRLLNLVNQLLDFRKMEEQQLKLHFSDGDIVFFTRDVCDSFNDLAKRKKIDYKLITGLTSLPAAFDHEKVERILFNILSNAFKFTGENGQITVTLDELEALKEDEILMAISIQDTGIGIPLSAQPRIFESFFQHDANSAVLNQGTGIGLSITKEFVKMHGGKIWVESEEEVGSTFSFQLTLSRLEATAPVAEIPEEIEMPKAELVKEPQLTGGTQPSVLIVEDDDDFRFYIKENLKANYRIFEAPNGKEGWQRTIFHHPDVIVCDVQMPLMNGMELVQKLKADKRTKHIPVILLTAADTPNATLDGLESGAIDFMTKPFNFSILEAKLHNILQLNQSFKETYSKQVTVSLPETEKVSDKDIFLQKTLKYIYDNLDNTQLSVEVLSAHLFISRASLYNKLLEFTGMSPVEFIRNVKLEKAKDLLEKTDMTVSSVAYETGFANPTYFTKVFKTKYNMTPSEFQNEKKKK